MPLGRLAGAYTSVLGVLQEPDAAPTTQAVRDLGDLNTALTHAKTQWAVIQVQVATLNATLKANNLPIVGM